MVIARGHRRQMGREGRVGSDHDTQIDRRLRDEGPTLVVAAVVPQMLMEPQVWRHYPLPSTDPIGSHPQLPVHVRNNNQHLSPNHH